MLDVLIAEAQKLALPCYDFIPASSGDEVLAHWAGRRSDQPEQFPSLVSAYKSSRHILSVDASLFKSLRLTGGRPFALRLVTRNDADESEDVFAWDATSGSLAGVTFEGTTPLKAVSSLSLPPLEAVLLYGGPDIDILLDKFGLRRWEYSSFIDSVAKDYQSFFYQECPLMTADPPFARVGGWHLYWQDDDHYLPREMMLMLWTFQDSEPWYEVFLTPMLNQVIKQRIT